MSVSGRKNGFTLIELLVTISIVAVVFGVVITSAAQSKKASRDLQRQSDLRTIQSALQQYYSDQIYYPLMLGTSIKFGSVTYLSSLPTDPSTGAGYDYVPSPSGCDNSAPASDCTSYCLYADLENLSSPDLGSCANVSGYNYAVAPP